MPLVIVVAIVLIAGLIWRARSTRHLTVEQSVERYRRTLGAVHDAAARSHPSETPMAASGDTRPSSRSPVRRGRNRSPAAASRRGLLVAAMAVVTIAVVGVVIATHHGKAKARTSASTTTARPAPRVTTTTTTPPAPTTTAPLVKTSGRALNSFTVSKPSYQVTVQTTGGQCWVEMRNPAGTALFAGTLAVGATQTITATDVTIRLGNPAAATITIDGTRVPFTIPSGSPATLHFQGTAAVS